MCGGGRRMPGPGGPSCEDVLGLGLGMPFPLGIPFGIGRPLGCWDIRGRGDAPAVGDPGGRPTGSPFGLVWLMTFKLWRTAYKVSIRGNLTPVA